MKTTLRVTLSDRRVTIRTTSGKAVKSVKSGLTRFLVKNTGPRAHDFRISGKKTAKLAKGKSATLNVALSKGVKIYTSSPGMRGALRVT